MLNLSRVITQIGDLSRNFEQLEREARDKLELAGQLLQTADWQELTDRIGESKTSMLTALPAGGLAEVTARPSLPEVFSVVAADGSQIVPDHHGPALCYLINCGLVMLHYGNGERPRMESFPHLFYREEDLFLQLGGRQVLVQGELLSAKRASLEAEYLEKALAEGAKSGKPMVAMEDGSLIKWPLEQGEDWQTAILERYLATLTLARELSVPFCGYLSGSRSTDVVNSLKLLLCPEQPVNCDKCPYKNGETPCGRLQGLTDTKLFKSILGHRGQRSQVFFSTSKVLQRYGEHKTAFFYLNAGSEIARLEIPLWVWEDKQLLNLVHGVAADQADKGQGYPVALTEAHEQAVIKGADRDAFYRLLEGSLIKQGSRVHWSPKSLRKRTGYI